MNAPKPGPALPARVLRDSGQVVTTFTRRTTAHAWPSDRPRRQQLVLVPLLVVVFVLAAILLLMLMVAAALVLMATLVAALFVRRRLPRAPK